MCRLASMDSQFILPVVLLLVGTVGSIPAGRMPASGKAAVGLGLLPLLGAWLASEFC